MRDFHKTRPSGSGTATKPTQSAAIIKPSITNEGTDSDDEKTQSDNEDESDSEHEIDENESGSESDQEEDEEKIEDKEEEEEEEIDEEIDYTTSLLYDDVDIRLNKPVDTNKGFVQEEGTDPAMTNIQQRNENPEISQVIKDAHVTLFIVPQKTEVPVSSSSHSSDLAAKFLNFSDIPTTEAEIVSPLDVPVIMKYQASKLPHSLLYLSQLSPILHQHTPPSSHNHYNPSLLHHYSLEQEVAELKKDHLHTQVTALVDEHLDGKLGATRDEFMNFLSASLTARITK
ncbi:hypothetical protein Tco_0736403 [Tanacetum coccineum]